MFDYFKQTLNIFSCFFTCFKSQVQLISSECVSLCLVFESEVQHSESHKHIFLSTHQTKNDSSLSSITIRSGNGWRELNQTYQYPNTQMILCCHVRVDRYQSLKEGDSKCKSDWKCKSDANLITREILKCHFHK